ncbi:MAG: ABC transporter substrate-binding protein [Spirochaetes bacterium]|nr:ABC transporter substrate-binding protein [Spirochaetota bacterium]
MFIAMVFSVFALLAVTSVFAEKVQVVWWHAMSGSRLKVVKSIVNEFNADHPDINLKALFTGSYAETLTKFISAYRTGNAPNLVQVYEVGTQTMLDSGAIVPVYKLPEMLGEKWDWAKYIIPILNYYSVNGKLYSMPFNSSTAMLYYNKDILRRAGLDPNAPPSTWGDLESMGSKLIQRGSVRSVLSFGWPGWIFEQMFATHNQLLADKDNGRSGRATSMYVNGNFGVKVIDTWARLAREKIFLYGGPEYSANQAFISGRISMLMQSTSSLAGIEKASRFKVGTTFLPHFAGYPSGNSVIGGGSLWVPKGQNTKELRGVWEYLKFLGKTKTAIEWHKGTGYFPTTTSAMKVLMDQEWFSKDQNFLTAFMQILSGRRDTAAATGVRIGPFVKYRELERAAIEKAVSGVSSPRRAMDTLERQANSQLTSYNRLFR